MVDISTLQKEVLLDLSTELNSEPSYDAGILENKVKMAIREVIMKRNYVATSMTDEEILEDLYNYISVIENVARYDYNQTGVEGEKMHMENGVSRTYESRDSLFKGVHAFVKVL